MHPNVPLELLFRDYQTESEIYMICEALASRGEMEDFEALCNI